MIQEFWCWKHTLLDQIELMHKFQKPWKDIWFCEVCFFVPIEDCFWLKLDHLSADQFWLSCSSFDKKSGQWHISVCWAAACLFTRRRSGAGANRKQANQPPNRCRSLSMSFEWFYKFWAKGYNIMKSQIRMARGQLGLEIIILIECWLLKTNKNICRTVLRSILRQHWRPTYLP